MPGLTELPKRLSRRGRRIGLIVLLSLVVGVPLAIVLAERAAQQRDAREAAQAALAARDAARQQAIAQRPHRVALPGTRTIDAGHAGPALAVLVQAYAERRSGEPSGGARCTRRRIEPGGRYVTFGCVVFDRGRRGGRSVLGRPFVGRVDLRERSATFCASVPTAAVAGQAIGSPLSPACIGRV